MAETDGGGEESADSGTHYSGEGGSRPLENDNILVVMAVLAGSDERDMYFMRHNLAFADALSDR